MRSSVVAMRSTPTLDRASAAALLTLLALLLSGCDNGGAERPATMETAAVTVTREADSLQVERGRRLFADHCAGCHGSGAEGHPQWRYRDAEGYFPPPPLNGTGHAWHHPRALLSQVIRSGSPGGGKMPAWGDRLNDQEIAAIINWFQSLWPDPVYAAWAEIDARSRGQK